MAVVCGGVVAFLSLLAAFWALPDLRRFFFVWDHNFGPAVSYACGKPFADITQPIPELIDFLNRRRADFDCGRIPEGAAFGPINAYANGVPYFLRGLGLYWRWRGVSWPSLAPLFGTLYAVSNVLVFFLFRQFLGNWWGLLWCVLYAYSPSNYYSVTYYEHYAKVPFFLAIILMIVSLSAARVVAARWLFAASVLGGLLLGIGFGIRADLWLLVVPCLAAMLFFSGADSRPRWSVRCAACAVLLATTIATALPAVMTNGRSYFWLQLVEGLSTDFDSDLSVRPGMYEWVPKYSDELGASWMQSHVAGSTEGLDMPSADHSVDRPRRPSMADWQTQETAGRRAYLTIMRYFPADFVTRPLAAVLKVTVDSFRTQPSFAAQFAAGGPNFFARTASFWSFISSFGVWLVFGLAAALFVRAQRHRRQALLCLLLVLYVGGATAVVFLPRHRWHLYFLGFLIAGITVKFIVDQTRAFVEASTAQAPGDSIAVSLRAAARGSRRVLPAVSAMVAAVVFIVVSVRMYQDREVGFLVERVLKSEKDTLRLEWRRAEGSAPVAVATDLVERFQTDASESRRFQYTDYLTATFSRDECREVGAVKAVYRASQPAYDHTMNIPLRFDDGSRFFVSAFPAYAVKFEGAYGFFEGIETPAGAERCLAGVARVAHPESMPLRITWHIPEHWRNLPRHQSIIFPPPGPR
jgi:hypothetical protein